MKRLISAFVISLFIFVAFAQSNGSQGTKNNASQGAKNNTSQGVKFKYKQVLGESCSYISTVEEDAYFDGILNNHAQIINRISTTVDEEKKDGSAVITTSFMTTTNTIVDGSKRSLSWGEEETVTVTRKPTGQLTIPNNSFMPTVRDVPVFPNKAVKPGDTWTAPGKEVHDLRRLFNMNEPIVIPFTANYTYIGDEVQKGKTFNVIEIHYEFYQTNTRKSILAGSLYSSSAGFTNQKLYWDSEKGILDHYTEDFEIVLKDVYGNEYLFKGTARAEITEYKSLNSDEMIKELQKTIDDLNLSNVTIKKGKKGLTISIENIQFEADSPVLMDSEKAKLDKICEILNQFPNDLLITGHCADRGTANARQKLSEERAQTVAEYLKKKEVRDEYHIFTQGKGATEPIATNNTEAGRAKNRRVEITLMD